ncbi:MAG: hypothetical protein F6J93_09165 [Oscillatoria sp. SIO1A7]|nr:hypothetical protein [Oscillatoria sp. SIO1A7]
MNSAIHAIHLSSLIIPYTPHPTPYTLKSIHPSSLMISYTPHPTPHTLKSHRLWHPSQIVLIPR